VDAVWTGVDELRPRADVELDRERTAVRQRLAGHGASGERDEHDSDGERRDLTAHGPHLRRTVGPRHGSPARLCHRRREWRANR
jgi:hypothetical protein